MRRILLLSVLLSLALSAVGSAAPPPTDAASSQGRHLAARVGDPRAADQRTHQPAGQGRGRGRPDPGLQQGRRGGRSGRAPQGREPDARGHHGRLRVRCLQPEGSTRPDHHRCGAAGPQVGHHRHQGDHRLHGGRHGSAHLEGGHDRPLGCPDTGCPRGIPQGRHASRIEGLQHRQQQRPLPHPRRERTGRPRREARGLRSLYGTRKITKRDQDYARQAWTLARSRNRVCDAKSALDPNDDGCADIVDLQATLVAVGRPLAARPSSRSGR